MKYILRYIYMLLCEIKSVFIKNKVIRYLEKSSISDVQPVIAKLKNSFKLSVFPYNYVNEYYSKKIDVYKDKTCGLFYVMDEGRKLYFSKKFRFKFHVRNYYRNLCIEQDKRSPHCYTSDTFSVDNDSVLLDVGAAEGIFALRNIEKVSQVYCFECDESWIEALEHTFSFCRDKVHIIRKFVSDKDDEQNMTLDSMNSSGKSYFVKLDIEGMETVALSKSMKFIRNADCVRLSVCTYHKSSHLREISEMFKNSITEVSDGYMFFYYDKEFSEPYIRRGILRILL
ncbi:MAG: hypothetical protein PUB89_00895 [Oscillospiraceae bacterium]|nr:hypothetical protein [Oscillospiraceae bacterium]